MKYVIIKCEVAGVDRGFPIMFPERLTHCEVANLMVQAVNIEFRAHGAEVYSAGFCYIYQDRIQATSGSESLNIKKDKARTQQDERILNMPEAMGWMLPC